MYPSSRAGYAVSTYDMTCCNRQYLPGFVIFWCAQYSTIFRTYSATVKIEQYAGEQQGNPYLCFTTVLHFSVHTLNCKPSIRARNPVVTGGSRWRNLSHFFLSKPFFKSQFCVQPKIPVTLIIHQAWLPKMLNARIDSQCMHVCVNEWKMHLLHFASFRGLKLYWILLTPIPTWEFISYVSFTSAINPRPLRSKINLRRRSEGDFFRTPGRHASRPHPTKTPCHLHFWDFDGNEWLTTGPTLSSSPGCWV